MKKTIKYFPRFFIKDLIKLLRKSTSKDIVVSKLKEKYLLNDKQITYIMSYSLKQLVGENSMEYKDFINGLVLLD